jgi:ADP-ribose pyrophosphatase YjhB (NUDIX family)
MPLSSDPPPWLVWAREIQAIAQSGLTFTRDPFDVERYERLRAIAADMLARYGDVPVEVCTTLFTSQAGYATPKMDVRGVAFQDGKLLLVRERSDGLWTLPGGWADVGQSPSGAVVKEVREESGFEVRAERVLMLLDRDRHDHPPIVFHTWKLFILCTITGGAAAENTSETDSIGFFAEDDLPPLSIGRVTAAQIARLFHLHRTGVVAADFD